MGKWQPASEAWVRAFRAALDSIGAGERRKMFGYDAVFLNGNMVGGLHEAGLVLRLPEDDRKKLQSEGGLPFVPMPGRPMREYVVVPEKYTTDAAGLRTWLGRAFDHASALPAKTAKKPSKTPSKTAKTAKASPPRRGPK